MSFVLFSIDELNSYYINVVICSKRSHYFVGYSVQCLSYDTLMALEEKYCQCVISGNAQIGNQENNYFIHCQHFILKWYFPMLLLCTLKAQKLFLLYILVLCRNKSQFALCYCNTLESSIIGNNYV